MTNMRGLTPICEAYAALAVIAKGETTRQLLEDYDPNALNQAEEAMTALIHSMSGAERIAVYPAHTEVTVEIQSGNAEGITFRGMVRDLPGIPRRITNLDSGTEFFTDPEVEMQVIVTKVPKNRRIGQYAEVS
jgi:hypothetical protein